MTLAQHPPVAVRFTAAANRFLAGGNFAVFALCALVFYQVFVAIMAFSPPAMGAWADFLEDFRTRCFRFDPRSGQMEMGSVWIMLSEPIALEVILILFWWKPLQELWRSNRRNIGKASIAALALVLAIAANLSGLGRARLTQVQNAFPSERLRSNLAMPAFTLADQDDNAISPASLKGRVVLVTGIYSTCTTACPMMLRNIRRTLDELTPEERAEMSVVAISLNPEMDTQPLREATSKMYGLKTDFHFVNGGAREVNRLLDDLGAMRTRDKESGQIVHSTLFILLDRRGKIAYRISNSAQEEGWLTAAIRALIAEKAS